MRCCYRCAEMQPASTPADGDGATNERRPPPRGDGVGSARLDAHQAVCRPPKRHPRHRARRGAAARGAVIACASATSLLGKLVVLCAPVGRSRESKVRVGCLEHNSPLPPLQRLHDQLIYKWLHGRSLLTSVLTDRYRPCQAWMACLTWRYPTTLTASSAERARSSFRRSYDRKDEHGVDSGYRWWVCGLVGARREIWMDKPFDKMC